MQTMKFKFKRIFIIPASWYHSARLVLIPFITSPRFVDKMVKPMAPKPPVPEPPRSNNIAGMELYKDNVDKYRSALKASQEALLVAWHKDVLYTSKYRIRNNGDGHYVIVVDTTIGGSRKFIAPFKQQWPISDMTLMN